MINMKVEMGGRVTMPERNEIYTANFYRETTWTKPLWITGAKLEVNIFT
jgi:hypothetical protein